MGALNKPSFRRTPESRRIMALDTGIRQCDETSRASPAGNFRVPGPDGLGCPSEICLLENHMKKLSLVLNAELEIPDDWELVEHPSGIYVLKVGDRFVDFDIVPLVTASTAPDATWSDEDEKFTDDILDMVTGLDSQMEITYLQ
jgi:hypothetical protein